MLRDRNLVPLSHQHQRVLALCVRIDRAVQAGGVDLESWQAEIHDQFEEEVCSHFAAEEKVLFPVAEQVAELKTTVDELRVEHKVLRKLFAKAASRQLKVKELVKFVDTLAHHIRKEERLLFEGMQKTMGPEQLAKLGAALNGELRPRTQICSLRHRPSPK